MAQHTTSTVVMLRRGMLGGLLVLAAARGANDAAAVSVSPGDLRLAHDFAADHLSCATNATRLPFSFHLGGTPSAALLPGWHCAELPPAPPPATPPRRPGSSTRTLSFTESVHHLVLTVNVTTFADSSATEWVLGFRNDAPTSSPVLSRVLAADVTIAPGVGGFELLHSL